MARRTKRTTKNLVFSMLLIVKPSILLRTYKGLLNVAGKKSCKQEKESETSSCLSKLVSNSWLLSSQHNTCFILFILSFDPLLIVNIMFQGNKKGKHQNTISVARPTTSKQQYLIHVFFISNHFTGNPRQMGEKNQQLSQHSGLNICSIYIFM